MIWERSCISGRRGEAEGGSARGKKHKIELHQKAKGRGRSLCADEDRHRIKLLDLRLYPP